MKFYTISDAYIVYLRSSDFKVPINKDEKNSRPYVGVLKKLNGFNYFVPLTSRNEKKVNGQVSIKLFDVDNPENKIGVLLVNNMIPVPEKECKEIDIDGLLKVDPKYGGLLNKQRIFLKENLSRVSKKIDSVYSSTTQPRSDISIEKQLFFKKICCDFLKLENKCQEYIVEKEKFRKKERAYLRSQGYER